MYSLLIASLFSFIATLLIVQFKDLHGQFSADSDLSGPQKFHIKPVPRIGGISVIIGLLTIIIPMRQNILEGEIGRTLFFCACLILAIGLAEDITKSVSVRTRLVLTAIVSFLSIYALQIHIIKLDIAGIDVLLAIPPINIALTIFAITGLTNAYNIIDGFNGLSSAIGITSLAAIAFVASILGDQTIIYLSLVMIGAISGFLAWNYPRGLIFLGDGGAYLIGYWVAIQSILLCYRHQNISPWFACLINIYPIYETIFSIWKKGLLKKISPGRPDRSHLHMLFYRRITNSKHRTKKISYIKPNPKVTLYLTVLNLIAVVPAALFFSTSFILQIFTLLFCLAYTHLYWRLVRFNAPKWLR